ncbi:MAG: hypothetical protein CO119_04245 [Flavobacteriales bacterium CG_4_9_14_3_um_filter_40_17]|nr:MAG: hypothetical protein CO119_04245 [Flavobacteriales bacterium CG_4_9_14_3_um_filter_40_17]
MKSNILISITVAFLLGCSSDSSLNSEIEAIEPECLQSIIINALQFEPTTPRASIKKYFYQEQEVFLISVMNFPDGQSAVVSSDCEPICALGGIDGPANDCEDFDSSAEFIETIWTDPR